MRRKASGSLLLALALAATASGDANRGPSRPAFPVIPSGAPVVVRTGSSEDLKAVAAEWSRVLSLAGVVGELAADPG